MINSLNQPDAREKLLEVRYNEFEYDRMFATLPRNFKKYKEKQNIKWMWSENSTGDRNTFEEIKEKTGKNESQVIKIMRKNLKPGSFRLWRKRVHNTSIKHRKKFQLGRKKLREKIKLTDIY